MKISSAFAMTAVLALLSATLPASALPVHCSGSTYLNSDFFSGSCSGTSCSTSLPPSNASINGNCSNGISFSAQGYSNSEFLSFTCQSGSFSTSTQGGYMHWSGYCSNGKALNISDSYVNSSFVSGSCTENGSFSGNIPGQYLNVQASCED